MCNRLKKYIKSFFGGVLFCEFDAETIHSFYLIVLNFYLRSNALLHEMGRNSNANSLFGRRNIKFKNGYMRYT